ncbi:hypothetical protein [Sphingomonas morindae]|uniref:Uncharacterized protein n=1 Tax=Sphingomonas morindae TaxID=1541170 RepID=A0ABY4XDN4_9SPHN|nr:hypothetical protein [Sphingomonas morindae]USI74876.1 hypothetical protein LHA26_17025 [Sphingomonas morindae]
MSPLGFAPSASADAPLLPGLDEPPAPPERPLDVPALLERLQAASSRPRYAFMVLSLIAQAADAAGQAGPYVREANSLTPLRDWLCDALAPMAERDHRRIALRAAVRRDLERDGRLGDLDADVASRRIDAEVRERVRASGKTNVSRAVSDLVRAGLMRRHYQGYRVDHVNRGAQRQAVYTIPAPVRRALGAVPGRGNLATR